MSRSPRVYVSMRLMHSSLWTATRRPGRETRSQLDGLGQHPVAQCRMKAAGRDDVNAAPE
jgi:hypothetical protein